MCPLYMPIFPANQKPIKYAPLGQDGRKTTSQCENVFSLVFVQAMYLAEWHPIWVSGFQDSYPLRNNELSSTYRPRDPWFTTPRELAA